MLISKTRALKFVVFQRASLFAKRALKVQTSSRGAGGHASSET